VTILMGHVMGLAHPTTFLYVCPVQAPSNVRIKNDATFPESVAMCQFFCSEGQRSRSENTKVDGCIRVGTRHDYIFTG